MRKTTEIDQNLRLFVKNALKLRVNGISWLPSY